MGAMDEPSPSDLLQVTITIAGFAVALIAIDPDGPLAPYLLLTGVSSLLSSAYAMAALWQGADLRLRDLFAVGDDPSDAALMHAGWALLLLGITYVALGVRNYVS